MQVDEAKSTKCTDPIYCMVILTYILALFLIAILGDYGQTMLQPYDQNGNVCGFGTLEDYPKVWVYFYEPAGQFIK